MPVQRGPCSRPDLLSTGPEGHRADGAHLQGDPAAAQELQEPSVRLPLVLPAGAGQGHPLPRVQVLDPDQAKAHIAQSCPLVPPGQDGNWPSR